MMASALSKRSSEEVLVDHLRCRMAADIEAYIERNYSPKVVILTSRGAFEGHDAVRALNKKLREHVLDGYEIVLKLTNGSYGYIEWRAREAGISLHDRLRTRYRADHERHPLTEGGAAGRVGLTCSGKCKGKPGVGVYEKT